MNTYKQVNVIIGLLFVGAVATLLYFLWDTARADNATERQLSTNIERGAFLFGRNCSSCHGITGQGAIERGGLPGAVLNTEDNRLNTLGDVVQKQARFRDTIRCGRIGTLMPPWSTEQGGPLNNFQIDQIVALLTGVMPPQRGETLTQGDIPDDPNVFSEDGWAHAIEESNHSAEFQPPKHLQQAIDDTETELTLDRADGLQADERASPNERPLLRLDDEPTDAEYEIVKVVDAPAGTTLTEEVGPGDTELVVELAAIFRRGDLILVDREKMQVVSAPALTTLAVDASAAATTLTVTDAEGLSAGDTIRVGAEKMRIDSTDGNTLTVQRGQEETESVDLTKDSTVTEEGDRVEVERGQEGTSAASHKVKAAVLEEGDTVVVERGAEGTDAADHAAGTEVFQGPILPPTGPLTGETDPPPCGQLAAQPRATPGPPIAVTGAISINAGDNFFDLNGQRNPELAVAPGDQITVNLSNSGSAPHNMRTTGADAEFDTADDAVSDPETITGSATGTLTFSFAGPGTYEYRCDFHPDQMAGQITVGQ